MRYRKRLVEITAVQWHKHGDDPDVEANQVIVKDFPCKHCKQFAPAHGWISTLEGGHVVCPGDWIITGIKGERYPCKPDLFALMYELVE